MPDALIDALGKVLSFKNSKKALKVLGVTAILGVIIFGLVFSANYFLTPQPKAKLTNPANNDQNVSPNSNLSWIPRNRPSIIADFAFLYSRGSVDLSPRVVYEIFIGTEKDDLQLDGSMASKQDGEDLYYRPKIELSPDTTYYWKIHYNNYLWNGEGESEIFMFETVANPLIKIHPEEPVHIAPGQCINISWDVKNANKILLNESNGKLNERCYANESKQVCPQVSTAYIITAINEMGLLSQKFVKIEVSRNPNIYEFSPWCTNCNKYAKNNEIYVEVPRGQPISFEYLIYGADNISISRISSSTPLDPFKGDVFVASPKTGEYRLKAYKKDGGYSTAAIMVVVMES